MRIFALMVVKNEDDIISDTIISALDWADKIFVMDNMSTDQTWEKLQYLEKKHDKIVLWGRYGGVFNDGLRQILFKDYSYIASDDDWWCRLDGDEFYIDDPRVFLSEISNNIDHIYNASFQYYYTEDDYIKDKDHPEKFTYKNLEWYKCNHSEIRFVKNKPNICWPQRAGWPCNLSKPYHLRIRLKHFQYRSSVQIQKRMDLRSLAINGNSFKHEIVSEVMWYRRRKFNVPQDVYLRQLRIVSKLDLNNSTNFIYLDEKLPPIISLGIKKAIKNIIIYIYMKFFNKHLFNL